MKAIYVRLSYCEQTRQNGQLLTNYLYSTVSHQTEKMTKSAGSFTHVVLCSRSADTLTKLEYCHHQLSDRFKLSTRCIFSAAAATTYACHALPVISESLNICNRRVVLGIVEHYRSRSQ